MTVLTKTSGSNFNACGEQLGSRAQLRDRRLRDLIELLHLRHVLFEVSQL
ncbi:MAG TPA: hypothetical protein VK437_06445 [Steroidobacteraceae bacterium]|nr:hypothetical protein [Steroidobacteraceae bacterium]